MEQSATLNTSVYYDGTEFIPCRCSSAITNSIEGGFNPSGNGFHGLLNASLIAASKISFGCGKSKRDDRSDEAARKKNTHAQQASRLKSNNLLRHKRLGSHFHRKHFVPDESQWVCCLRRHQQPRSTQDRPV